MGGGGGFFGSIIGSVLSLLGADSAPQPVYQPPPPTPVSEIPTAEPEKTKPKIEEKKTEQRDTGSARRKAASRRRTLLSGESEKRSILG